ncbi:circularly permuted type 2 ATP-grasp protein [Turicimonas muris]
MESLVANAQAINRLLARYGVKFGIYKNNEFIEQLFPFDPVPRVISAEEFEILEQGLKQRVNALNAFLKDIYTDKKIIKDGVVPDNFVFSSSGFLPECDNFVPPAGVFSHISGIDLVQADSGEWFILEDNLRIPSGASYPLIARKLSRRASPETFKHNKVDNNADYGRLLAHSMQSVNPGGLNVILTPGRYNSAFFEHSYLAEVTGFPLVMPNDLFVEENKLYIRTQQGGKALVGAIYRRISDEYLDPLTFNPESLIGVPGIMSAYLAGNLAIVNAPGNGVADDKGTYYFVPKMIEYYLNEKPILHNAPTYLPMYREDMEYCLDNIHKLVIKDVAEAGGYGVLFGKDMDEATLGEWRQKIQDEPRRFILQEVINFIDLPVLDGETTVPRKADLRAYVVSSADKTDVWHCGLTRFSRVPDSFVVNSSQGGGFKDTWVMSR